MVSRRFSTGDKLNGSVAISLREKESYGRRDLITRYSSYVMVVVQTENERNARIVRSRKWNARARDVHTHIYIYRLK